MREAELLAPCVAVVGPANSGKTTLLHLLDDALQRHPSAPLAYVVKGNPDGTGRYLFHAPELRESLKERVKGAWHEATVGTVCNWIGHCRRQLDLVLVDMGGRHAPGNAAIFEQCTHSLTLARRFEDPEQERAEGMDSWVDACQRSGLHSVARLRSAWQEGTPDLDRSGDELSGTFRADASSPGDSTNDAVIGGLVEALLALCGEHRRPPYLDLRLGRDWRPDDLPDLAGLAPRLLETVGEGKTLTLGGRAPVWADDFEGGERGLLLKPDPFKTYLGLYEEHLRSGSEGSGTPTWRDQLSRQVDALREVMMSGEAAPFYTWSGG